MKEIIEINREELIKLFVEKINFLLKEYVSLHSSFVYDGKGRTKTDPIKIAESYQRFLAESGDISRLLMIYDRFLTPDIKDKK
jgi:hypothetical protein